MRHLNQDWKSTIAVRRKLQTARIIIKDTDYLQNLDKQAKIHNLEKHIDPVRCLLSNGVDQMVYNLYDLTPEEIVIVEGKK